MCCEYRVLGMQRRSTQDSIVSEFVFVSACVCVCVCFYHKALGFNPVVLCCIKFQTWINCDVIYMPMSDYTHQCNSYVFVYLCTHTPRQQSSFSGRSNKPGLNILFCSQMWSAALRLTHTHTHTRASIHARSWKTTSQSDLLLHHYGNIMRRRRRKKKKNTHSFGSMTCHDCLR